YSMAPLGLSRARNLLLSMPSRGHLGEIAYRLAAWAIDHDFRVEESAWGVASPRYGGHCRGYRRDRGNLFALRTRHRGRCFARLEARVSTAEGSSSGASVVYADITFCPSRGQGAGGRVVYTDTKPWPV